MALAFEELMLQANSAGVRLRVDEGELRPAAVAESLFHVPLLALTLLVIIAGDRNGTRIGLLSAWASGVLSERTAAAGPSFQRFEWSVLLRTRCADALVFLEVAGLAATQRKAGAVTATPEGHAFLRRARGELGELGQLLRDLERAYSIASARGLPLL